MQCEFFSLEGLSHLLNTVGLIKDNLNQLRSRWEKERLDVYFEWMRRKRGREGGQYQCDQIGQFIAHWATSQSRWQQLFSPNCPHCWAIFVKMSKSFIFVVKSFWATFIVIWRLFTGHTGQYIIGRQRRCTYLHTDRHTHTWAPRAKMKRDWGYDGPLVRSHIPCLLGNSLKSFARIN